MKNLFNEGYMKKMVFLAMFILISSAPVFAESENHGTENRGGGSGACNAGYPNPDHHCSTPSSNGHSNNNVYSTVFSNGDTFVVNLSARRVRAPSSGRSEVRNQLSWRQSGSWGAIYGNSYALAWSNFENGSNGELYEDDPAHGASFVLMYAFPTANCSNGVMYFAAVQSLSATSLSDLGPSVSFTPLFGQMCGTQISSLTAYTLTQGSSSSTGTATSGTTSTGATSASTGTTSTGTATTGTTSTSAN